jgi:hypothetical protein
VQTEKLSSEINTKGVFENIFIHEKMINNIGIIEIMMACFFEVENEKIPAKMKSIQKIFKTDIIKE